MDKNKMYGENHEMKDQKYNTKAAEHAKGEACDKSKAMDAHCKDKKGEHASKCESGSKAGAGKSCSTEKSGEKKSGCCDK